MCRVISPPDQSLQNTLRLVKIAESPLYFRVILEQQRAMALQQGDYQWMEFILSTIEPILQFEPSKHRSFDILALWFFLLENIADYRFGINARTAEKVELFKLQLSSGDMDFISKKLKITKRNMFEISNDNAVLYLASKAMFIYLCRIISSKSESASINEEMDKAFESLMSLHDQPKYSHFSNFFKEMQSLTSSFMTLPNFESSLVRTLLPIAPYMVKIINLNEDDLERLKEEGGLVSDEAGPNNTGRSEDKLPELVPVVFDKV